MKPQPIKYGKSFAAQIKKAKKDLAAQPDPINKPISFWLTLPPSVNDMYYTEKPDDKGKTHRRLSADARAWKREASTIAEMEALGKGWKVTRHSKVVVELTAYWADTKVQDMNNLHKALADVLEKNIYMNDSMALLRDMNFYVDERNPRVDLKIYQLEE
jgi:crossover junction endodeoxyribonuclease RusA